MRIAYFVNSFNSINWGGQATSNGLKYLIELNYPDASLVPINMPKLPFRKIKFLRKLIENKLYNSLLNDDFESTLKYLKKFNINENFFDGFSHICFNGEGAIHSKSGHLIVLMALLYLAKKKNIFVAAVNQTVDLSNSPKLEVLVKKIYSNVDFLSVRETISYEYVRNNLNLIEANLIPDAAYGLPKLTKSEIDNLTEQYKLPLEFIAITGSSILKRNKTSLNNVSKLIAMIQEKFSGIPIIFLANAKTDIWIAHRLKEKFNYKIIEPPVKYIDATAIISKAKILIGGRQHPNIFAYEYYVPYIPFGANTTKNLGVSKLQGYPLEPIPWDTDYTSFSKIVDLLTSTSISFDDVKINKFNIFDID